MKGYNKTKESSCLQYWDVNNLYGWAMSKKLSVNNFEHIKDTFQFNKNFTKNFNDESDEVYFVEVDVQCPENVHNLYNDLPFLPTDLRKKSK